jgi:hypothetical protein
MKQLRIYLDTSVISFLFADDAPDFRRVTEEFFAKHAPKYELSVSEVVLAVRRETLITAINQAEGYRHPLRLLSPLEVEDENEG